MKYRLKDRELQKKLDEATDGEFSRRLQNDRERMDGMILIGCMGMIEDRRRHNHTKLQRMTLCFALDEIEEVAEYDPHKWNRWPDVTPPANVTMRVTKVRNGNIETFCCRTWVPENNFDLQWRKDFGGAWWAVHGGKPDEIDEDTWEPGYTFLFRPWEDEE